MKKRNSLKNVRMVGGLLGCISIGALSHNVFGNDSGVTISPMFGKYLPSQNRSLEDAAFGSLGIGYDFENNWGIEATYLRSSTEIKDTSIDADVDLLRFDALYYLNDSGLQPYLVGGLGQADFETDAGFEDDETIGNVGVGIKYMVNRVFALRGDFRLVQGLESGESDYLVGFGAVFKFGQSGPVKKATPAVKPTPVPGPIDSDGDGVVDSQDSCPGTASGINVDNKGCELDTDSDGVADSSDKCPGSEAGSKVDETGCYIVLKEAVSVSLNVNFATNSADVVSESNPDIQKVADFLRSYPLANVVIEGHTDSMGAAAYNKDLSQRRAQTVADILINNYQIASSRVSATGYGEENPLVDNSTAENRAKNRRVTAVVSAVAEKIVK